MGKRYLSIALLFLAFGGYGQNKAYEITGQGLRVGDTVPLDHRLEVINHATPTVTLQEFEGKLVILDFWATWCRPCIASFPKLDTLQHEFMGELQIIPVAYEPLDKVSYSLSKVYPNYPKSAMPFVYADNYLRRLFPHQVLPHYVWLSPSGIVLSVTGGEEVNVTTIKMVLDYLKSSAL